MKNRRQIAFNKKFTLIILLGILLLILSVTSLTEGSTRLGIGLGLAAALFLVGGSLLLPCFYLYDKEGVTLVYVYMPNERYLWKNVYEIRVTDDDETSSHRSLFFLFFGMVYEISGDVEGKERFYMEGHIQKSIRNKHLIQKYWDGTITGYFDDEIEDFKKWRARRQKKKQKQLKQNFAHSIPPMERKARSEIRSSLQHCIVSAAEMGLILHIEYYYVTDDSQKHNSRPSNAYTYTVLVTLSQPNETNADRTLRMEAELLRVTAGKNGYHGSVNQGVCLQLESAIMDALDDIDENGFDGIIKQ